MSTLLYRLGRAASQRPLVTIAIWFGVAAMVVVSSSQFGRTMEDSFEVPGLDSQNAVDLLSEVEATEAGLTARVVATPLDDRPAFDEAEPAADDLTALRGQLQGLAGVITAASPALSEDGRVALITLQYETRDELSVANLDELLRVVASYEASDTLRVEAGGELFFAFDEGGGGAGEMVGILAAAVILVVAFGSVIAMGLPIGIALLGLGVGVSSMALVTRLIEIPSWAPEIAAMVGLGVGIDYALFIVTRHREFLGRGMAVHEAAARANATAGMAVVVAGGTVVIAILGLAVAGVPFMTAAGVAISLVALLMVLASVTLLPAFLGLAGHRINGLRRRSRAASALGSHDGPSPRWQRWGRHVSAHPWPYAVGVTLLLLGLTAPVAALRLGFLDEGTQAESTTQRRAYDLVAEGFGPGTNGPLLVAIDLGDDASVVEPLRTAIAADEGIATVGPAAIDDAAGVATIVAIPTTAPQDADTVATIARLRAEVIPAALASTGASAHIGGQTAAFSDVAGRVGDRLPIFVFAVLLLSFLLLMVVFRSVLVPLKAVVLNLLSIGASYGVLVMVFQWGWAKGLFGLESTVPIVSFIPMFMFAILFGLSMDYEVFLLSRVREHYLESRDNEGSVIHGIASTARVITSAALIMISVFAGFVLADDPVTKMFGLGLATAIFVDATIVRIVLVPATMKLMGDANWWLPAWLDRLLPTVHIEGELGLPAPEPVVEPHAAPVDPSSSVTRPAVAGGHSASSEPAPARV